MIQRGLFLGTAALLAVALTAHLWVTSMEAPQYKGEESLHVYVAAFGISGDLHEIKTLNQYMGVTLPEDPAELKAVPFWLGGLGLLSLAAAVVEGARRRWLARALVLLFVAGFVASGLVLERRLYAIGHDRGEAVFARIDDFTPPILGSKQIANFRVTTSLGLGGWALVGASVLAGAALVTLQAERRRHVRAP